MSGVRVLVGTRKGAFVLTADGARKQWDVQGRTSAGGRSITSRARRPTRIACTRRRAGWFGQVIQRSERRRQDLGAGRQQVRLRRRAGHAPVVRRHAAPVGVQARLASRAVADRSGHRLRRRRGRRAVPHRPTAAQTWQELPGLREPRLGPALAAGRRRHVPAHDPARSERSASGSSSRSPRPARSAPTTAARPGSRSTAACTRSTSPTRTPRSATASTASRCTRRARTCCSCRSTGTSCAATTPATRGTRSAATCRPISGSRSTSTRTSRRPSTSSRSRATPSTSRPTASCASTAAAPAATSGRR